MVTKWFKYSIIILAILRMLSACDSVGGEKSNAEDDEDDDAATLPGDILASRLKCQPFEPNPEDGKAAIDKVEIACRLEFDNGKVYQGAIDIFNAEYVYKDGKKVRAEVGKPDPRTEWSVLMTVSRDEYEAIDKIAADITSGEQSVFREASLEVLIQKALVSYYAEGGFALGHFPVNTSISRTIKLENVGEYRARFFKPKFKSSEIAVPETVFSLAGEGCAEEVKGYKTCETELTVQKASLGALTEDAVIEYDDGVAVKQIKIPVSGEAKMMATRVIGQDNFDDFGSGLAADKLGQPVSVALTDSGLLVSDRSNNRILKFSVENNFVSGTASEVFGQPDFEGGSVYAGATISGKSFQSQNSLDLLGTKIIVADLLSNRILIWNDFSVMASFNANIVIGQSDFITNTSGRSSIKFYEPNAGYFCSSGLVIADTSNNRVLTYDSIPSTNGAAASHVLGQVDFTSGSASSALAGMSAPQGVYCSADALYVADTGNDAVKKWQWQAISDGTAPSKANTKVNAPAQVFIADGRVFVVNTGSNQVLIWNSVTQFESNASPSLAYPDASDIPAGNALNAPQGAASDGVNLYVADTYNNRVLVVPLPEK